MTMTSMWVCLTLTRRKMRCAISGVLVGNVCSINSGTNAFGLQEIRAARSLDCEVQSSNASPLGKTSHSRIRQTRAG